MTKRTTEAPRTLKGDLRRALESYYHGCSHEEDIAQEVTGAVEKVLERYGLLNTPNPDLETGAAADPGCYFCGSKEYRRIHAPYCAAKEATA